jgi:hypothetical protein
MSKTTTDRNDPELHEVQPNGQNKKYLVLGDEERAKGFVRPVRRGYIHKKCGTKTEMGLLLCETYARQPAFYNATFCCGCGAHFRLVDPNGERAFTWVEDGEGVGT